jgi:uroporphyrinogen-III synthase
LLLKQKGMEVTGVSLVQLTPVTYPAVPAADWLFFYSKNGVAFFFSQLQPLDLAKVGSMHMAAYGKATAEAIREAGYAVAYTGTGDAAGTAPAFLTLAEGKTVVFARALNSRHALLPYLSAQIQCVDLIVYENTPITSVDIPLTDYAVLTSPINAISYLKNVTPQPFQRYIAIGSTTAEALSDAGIRDVVTAEFPSEVSLAMTILKLEDDKNPN